MSAPHQPSPASTFKLKIVNMRSVSEAHLRSSPYQTARRLDHLSSADKERANPQTDQESLGHQIIQREENQDCRVQVTPAVSAPPLRSSPPPLMAHIIEDPATTHGIT